MTSNKEVWFGGMTGTQHIDKLASWVYKQPYVIREIHAAHKVWQVLTLFMNIHTAFAPIDVQNNTDERVY